DPSAPKSHRTSDGQCSPDDADGWGIPLLCGRSPALRPAHLLRSNGFQDRDRVPQLESERKFEDISTRSLHPRPERRCRARNSQEAIPLFPQQLPLNKGADDMVDGIDTLENHLAPGETALLTEPLKDIVGGMYARSTLDAVVEIAYQV